MIRCPTCKHDEFVGAVFCSECGTSLDLKVTTQSLETNTDSFAKALPNLDDRHYPSPVESVNEAIVTLHIIGMDQFLPLTGRGRFILGRVSGGDVSPDIDLMAYNAYVQGVSRIHAAINIDSRRVCITDLGSANGTRVNDNKLLPQVSHDLQHGDIIKLGKLKIQTIIRSV